MVSKEEMDLDNGFDSPPPVPPMPRGVQLHDGYSPVQRDGNSTPVSASSTAWERTHAKRRSNGGQRQTDEESRPSYGPLGPLGPPR
ncbi:hypothetical protein FRC12_021063 [Ceratobasidium sp. 428]|nr:hypothetical protein FRC12_021063 [Ceratobasidium sp. 428]